MAQTKWELLVSGDELSSFAKERCKTVIEETFDKNEITQKQNEGWTVIKEYKKTVKMTKPELIY